MGPAASLAAAGPPWMHRDADASRALPTGAPTAQNASGDRHYRIQRSAADQPIEVM